MFVYIYIYVHSSADGFAWNTAAESELMMGMRDSSGRLLFGIIGRSSSAFLLLVSPLVKRDAFCETQCLIISTRDEAIRR